MAKSLGADHVIKVTTRDPEELANQVEGILGTKPDASFECSGTDFSMAAGIYVSVQNLNCMSPDRCHDNLKFFIYESNR